MVPQVQARQVWLGLIVGNTRLHWGGFAGTRWLGGWHAPHLGVSQVQILQAGGLTAGTWQQLGWTVPLPPESGPIPLAIASVVPQQTQIWQVYEGAQVCARTFLAAQFEQTYPTLGLDRLLNLLGAGDTYGWPTLVIDAGTALTMSAADRHRFLGGSIAPGLALQAQALALGTAALPQITFPDSLPPRWGGDTPSAIHSGIVHSVLAGLRAALIDWRQQYPQGSMMLTGGDGPRLQSYCRQQYGAEDVTAELCLDPDLAFWGLRRWRFSPKIP
jgi:type III pantothenate kinase